MGHSGEASFSGCDLEVVNTEKIGILEQMLESGTASGRSRKLPKNLDPYRTTQGMFHRVKVVLLCAVKKKHALVGKKFGALGERDRDSNNPLSALFDPWRKLRT
jgi:hypothetical protein